MQPIAEFFYAVSDMTQLITRNLVNIIFLIYR